MDEKFTKLSLSLSNTDIVIYLFILYTHRPVIYVLEYRYASMIPVSLSGSISFQLLGAYAVSTCHHRVGLDLQN